MLQVSDVRRSNKFPQFGDIPLDCCAENPAYWDDIALVWPRYRYLPENAEFANALPFRETDLKQVVAALADADAWYVYDLVGQRVFTSGRVPRLWLRGMPAPETGTDAEIAVLPPWWELHQQAGADALCRERSMPANIPNPRRDVLWGSAMTRFFAGQMLGAIRDGKQWVGEDWKGRPCGSHELTVTVHRDWLMTPRGDLGGGIPRAGLHGGKNWIGSLADGQRDRVQKNEDPLPLSTDLSTYADAAFGRHEMVLYFDACRETIAAGWRWLIDDQNRIAEPQVEQRLAEAMDDFLAHWLESPFEGGPPPAEVIRCDRLRIPLVSRGDEHVLDCDCPICDMMASGMLGPSFLCFDGHHLELEDEFAFSMCETRAEWEEEQREWKQRNAQIESDMQLRAEKNDTDDGTFDSVWQNTWVSDEGLPGDALGHLGLAFLVADMVGSLQENKAEQADVDSLNNAFRAYRSEPPSHNTGDALKRTLEQLSNKHHYLVSRSADLQSRIDDRQRALDNPDADVSS